MNIDNYFSFLEKSFGFSKIPEYGYSRELHNDYVKNEIIIKIIYDGDYWVTILKPKINITDILKGDKHTTDYEFTDFDRYNLDNLDLDKSIWNSVSLQNSPFKKLVYYSKLLNDNSEILNGNLKKLGWTYMILTKLGLKKNKCNNAI